MSATTMIHVRIDEQVKAQATETLAAMGLTVSDAVRVFLTRVIADQEMPFTVKAPNAASRAAMVEAGKIVKGRKALFTTADDLMNDIEKAGSQ